MRKGRVAKSDGATENEAKLKQACREMKME